VGLNQRIDSTSYRALHRRPIADRLVKVDLDRNEVALSINPDSRTHKRIVFMLGPVGPRVHQKLDDERLRADIDPMDLLFARTTARHIHELIVAGRTVVREGEIVGIDYASLRDELLAHLRSGIAAGTAFVSALSELDRIIAAHFAQATGRALLLSIATPRRSPG
jgi:hypothetical protein